jgi:orotidine-5'-phosphate decarboxylase
VKEAKMKFLYLFMTIFCVLQSAFSLGSEVTTANTAPKKFIELIRSRRHRVSEAETKEGIQTLYSVRDFIEKIKIVVDGTLPEKFEPFKKLLEELNIKIEENTRSKAIGKVSLSDGKNANLIEELFNIMALKKVETESKDIKQFKCLIEIISTITQRMSHISIFMDPEYESMLKEIKELSQVTDLLGFIPVYNKTLSSVIHAPKPREEFEEKLLWIPLDVNKRLENLPQIKSPISQIETPENASPLPYEENAGLAKNQAAQKLFSIMACKKTNIGVRVNTESFKETLKILLPILPYICLIKICAEEYDDFLPEDIAKLKELAKQHDVMILQDSKFADSTETVQAKYTGAYYRIADWAHFITIHPCEGIEILDQLKTALLKANINDPRGAIVITQTQNLLMPNYTQSILNGIKKRSEDTFLAGIEHVTEMPPIAVNHGLIKIFAQEIPLNISMKKVQKTIALVKERRTDVCIFRINNSTNTQDLPQLQKDCWNNYYTQLPIKY